MSLTIVQSAKAAASPTAAVATTTVAFGSSPGANTRLIIMAFSAEVRGTVSTDFSAGSCAKTSGTAVIGAITLDKTLQVLDSGAGLLHRAGIWSCICTGAGSVTFTLTTPGAGGPSSYWTCAGTELSDSGGSAPTIDNTASSSNGGVASSNPATAAITPSGFEALVVASCAFTGIGVNPDTITEGGGFTLIGETEDSTTTAVGSHIRKLITSGNATPSWALAGSRIWTAAGVAYVGTSGASGGRAPSRITLQAVNRSNRF